MALLSDQGALTVRPSVAVYGDSELATDPAALLAHVEQMRATLQVLQDQVDGLVFNRVDYAEHARRGYGDSVQFYMDSAEYYSGEVPRRVWWFERLPALWPRRPAGNAQG